VRRAKVVDVKLTAENVFMLLQVCESGCSLHPTDALAIAQKLRESLAQQEGEK